MTPDPASPSSGGNDVVDHEAEDAPVFDKWGHGRPPRARNEKSALDIRLIGRDGRGRPAVSAGGSGTRVLADRAVIDTLSRPCFVRDEGEATPLRPQMVPKHVRCQPTPEDRQPVANSHPPDPRTVRCPRTIPTSRIRLALDDELPTTAVRRRGSRGPAGCPPPRWRSGPWPTARLGAGYDRPVPSSAVASGSLVRYDRNCSVVGATARYG